VVQSFTNLNPHFTYSFTVTYLFGRGPVDGVFCINFSYNAYSLKKDAASSYEMLADT